MFLDERGYGIIRVLITCDTNMYWDVCKVACQLIKFRISIANYIEYIPI